MTSYPDNWNEIAQQVKERDNYTCQECFREFPPNSTYLNVHHKRELSQGGTNDPSNLISLCFSCHTDHHKHMQRAFKGKVFNKSKPFRR
jgi:5-methylcytosine-specific restriction endonuclease McrA